MRADKSIKVTETLRLLPVREVSTLLIPFVDVPVNCGNTGFPSPAEDHKHQKLSLDELLNVKENTTYFFEAAGDSMADFGIQNGSVLVVDTTLDPIPGEACLCRYNGSLMAKIVEKRKDGVYLVSANPKEKAIRLEENAELVFFGVITSVINRRIRNKKSI